MAITRISDLVHGIIHIEQPIIKGILETPVFQRLRSIKQLGLASLVFPSADYSRFAHSLGVYHIVKRFIEALRANKDQESLGSETDPLFYQVAALVHDIGHFPFSHTMEDALNDIIPEGSTAITIKTGGESQPLRPEIDHEKVGLLVLEHDVQMQSVLENISGLTSEIIYRIITDRDPERPPFSKFVSSDLDADRMDYLSRTSKHTGLPYGSIDLDYLVDRVEIDNAGNLGFNEKALRTVEHLLLSRWIEYQQVIYNKSVVGLEHSLKIAIRDTVSREKLDFTESGIKEMIKSNKWKNITDDWMMEQLKLTYMKRQKDRIEDAITCAYEAVLERLPPKCLFTYERLINVDDTQEKTEFSETVSRIEQIVEKRLNRILNSDSVFIVINAPSPEKGKGVVTFDLAKLDSKAIRIIRNDNRSSVYIHDREESLVKPLFKRTLCSARVFMYRSKYMKKYNYNERAEAQCKRKLSEAVGEAH